MVVGAASAWAEEVTYTISSRNTLTTSGTAPTGSSATIEETYSTSKQMTSGNSQTLTLKGYDECKVTKLTLSMRSNSSGGAGKLSYSRDGGTNYIYIIGSASSGVSFNQNSWNGAWSTSYTDITKDVDFMCGTSDVIIRIAATANSLYCQSYTITYEKSFSYTITALSSNESYGTVTVSGKRIIANPSEGYRVSLDNPYDVTSGEATITQEGNIFTVEAEDDCTIRINFEEVPQHNAFFNVNGQTSTTSYIEGATISFPADPERIYGNDFIGWITSPIQGVENTSPILVTEALMGNSDITFYAVFAAPTTIIANETKSYGFETESDSNWNIDGPYRTFDKVNTGNCSGKINTNNTYVTFKKKVKVTEFSFAFTRTSTNNNYYVYIETSTDNTKWTAVETYPMSSFNSDGTFTTKSHTFDGKSELYVRFHCYNTTAIRFVDDVTITYKKMRQSYTNYCTTIPTSATIPIASACTDGSLYYGTYSNMQPFVVPSDLDVYEMTIANGVISKEKYETGAVVPANTGVLVAAQAAGNYTVNFSSDEGTSVLGASNMLRASGNGIDADAMEMFDANCKYYRLTMHNGTQIGFYWGAENGAAFNVAANKAYLAVPEGTSQGARGFNLYGGPTGIKEVFDSTDQFSSYNLQGQRVAANKKGLVIKNGKKYFNK